MSNPYKDPVGAAALVVVLALQVVGIVAFGLGSGAWVAMTASGLLVTFGLAMHHDRAHRRRSERPHAMWGLDDRNNPIKRRRRT